MGLMWILSRMKWAINSGPITLSMDQTHRQTLWEITSTAATQITGLRAVRMNREAVQQ
jgi:hypothetical protein